MKKTSVTIKKQNGDLHVEIKRSKWINTFVRGPKPSALDLTRFKHGTGK